VTEKKEKEVKISRSVSREEFDNLAAKVRRMSDNWKRFWKMHIGHDKDGKVGSIKLNVYYWPLLDLRWCDNAFRYRYAFGCYCSG